MQKTHNGPLVLYPCQLSPQSLIYNIFHFITFLSLAFVIDLPIVRKVRNGAACRNGGENSRGSVVVSHFQLLLLTEPAGMTRTRSWKIALQR